MINPLLEFHCVGKSGNVDGDNKVTGIGGAMEVGVKIHHVIAKCGAVERTRQQAEQESKAVTLWAADR